MSAASYRVAVRYGGARPRYHIIDVAAASLREAMLRAAESMPAGSEDADLVEIRKQTDPAERSYTPG